MVTVVKDNIDGQLYVLKEIDLTRAEDSVKEVRHPIGAAAAAAAGWLSFIA